MEHLIINLKENLILRKQNELNKINTLDKESDKELILIASGKIFELDFLINSLDNMINYFEKTKTLQ